MVRVVGIDALETEAGALLREVESGESIIVTRSGRAVARLVPEEAPGGPADEPTLADVVIADRGPR